MEYGRIIRHAWNVTWRNKILWIFGIAAALFGAKIHPSGGGGQGVNYSLNSQDWDKMRRGMPFLPWERHMPFGPGIDWQQIGIAIAGLLAIGLIVAIILAVLRVIVRYTSLGAMIGMVDEIETQEGTSFRGGLRQGWKRLLHLLAINIILGLISAIIVGLLIVVIGLVAAMIGGIVWALSQGGSGIMTGAIIVGIIAGLGLLLLMIAVSLAIAAAVTVLREFAFRASVLEQQGVIDALKSAVTLVRQQPQESLLMWLIMWAIRLGLGMVAIPLVAVAIAVMIIPAAGLGALTEAVWPAMLAFVPMVLLVFVIATVIKGIYTVFRSSVWTLTFRELDRLRIVSTEHTIE